jgi:RNA polymerase sigma factor (sigma-70 family)
MEAIPEISHLQAGSQEAFRQLVMAYQQMVYNTSLGMLQQESDAEDITQEVFISVFQHIREFRSGSALSTWIYRITVNKCMEFIRYKNRRKRIATVLRHFGGSSGRLSEEKADFVHPGVKLQQKELATQLFRAMARLPVRQHSAFVLHKIEGLSYQEIGEVLGLSVSSVESLLFRAKKNLQMYLGAFYEEFREDRGFLY